MAHQTEQTAENQLTSEEIKKLISLLKHPRIKEIIQEIESK